jgi:hypothetical protein
MPNGRPYQSKLNPYRRDIAELRATRPPTPYARIAEILKERHGMDVSGHTVWAFVKSRSKGRKVYAMQLEDEPAPPPAQPAAGPTPPASSGKTAAQEAREKARRFNEALRRQQADERKAEQKLRPYQP